MRRVSCLLALLGSLVILGGIGVAQPPPDKEKKEKEKGPRGKGPGGFQLGRVLPPFLIEELNLTEEQEKQIATLEKEVKARLGKILTAEQKKKLEGMRGPKGKDKDKDDKDKDDKDKDKKDKDKKKDEK